MLEILKTEQETGSKDNYRQIIDDLIDRALDCQERILRNPQKSESYFINDLSAILSLQNRLSKKITNQICKSIDFIQSYMTKQLESQKRIQTQKIESMPDIKRNLTPVSSDEISQVALHIMNKLAQYEYDKMPPNFRQMVKVDNPLMSFFVQAYKMDERTFLKQNYKELDQLTQNLKGNLQYSCKNCFHRHKTQFERSDHEQRCLSLKKARRHTTLKIGKTHYCQFGCGYRSTLMQQMSGHFQAEHTYEELEAWGINKNLLKSQKSIN